jgi:outer membrane protein
LLKQNPFDPNSPIVPFFDQLERNNAQQFSFGMNIPLFNGLQIRTAVKQSKIAYKNAELDLMNEKFLLKNTIQKSYADAKAAFKTYQANQQGLASFKENFEYAKQRFEANLINSVDYNDAATRYFNARTESLIALYDYIFKSKVLDFYKGKKLEF